MHSTKNYKNKIEKIAGQGANIFDYMLVWVRRSSVGCGVAQWLVRLAAVWQPQVQFLHGIPPSAKQEVIICPDAGV
jgi:hypothetical protein